jgi:methyltransferase (TIGR00027 family)
MVVGYVLFVGKMVLYSRHSGASQTVLASFFTRWMQHQLRLRRDVPCARLMRVLPNASPLGWHLFVAPTLLGHRLTGYVPKLYRYPYQGVPPMNDQPAARTTFYDRTLARYLPQIEQFVVLGAGLDTRSYRLPHDTPVRCFEVDTPKTQAFKREMLAKAGIDASRVTFVPADFEREDWFEKLVDAGFDPEKPSFFLWESVTMYLDRPAVESTLRKIAGTAPGSAVAFDYFSLDHLADRSLFMRYARAAVKAFGEPFGTFGLDTSPPACEQAASFVASCGLSLEEHLNIDPDSAQHHPRGGFVTATVR